MQFTDRSLVCADCGREFIFTAGEQVFFFDKQFKNDPKRCKPCKTLRSGGVGASATGQVAGVSVARTETRTVCSVCQLETTVPFKPTQGRPVLCRPCLQKHGRAAMPPGAMPAVREGGEPMLELAGAGVFSR